MRTYFRHEASYKDLYSDVWLYSDWAGERGLCKTDTGIDLVAKTRDTNEYHAIQCKFYSGSRYFCESLFWASQPKQAAKT
nr:hypothetical protein [Bathymodiolus japonicus methanotrophic gill symbiont]